MVLVVRSENALRDQTEALLYTERLNALSSLISGYTIRLEGDIMIVRGGAEYQKQAQLYVDNIEHHLEEMESIFEQLKQSKQQQLSLP